jgi:hypothetical protein
VYSEKHPDDPVVSVESLTSLEELSIGVELACTRLVKVLGSLRELRVLQARIRLDGYLENLWGVSTRTQQAPASYNYYN